MFLFIIGVSMSITDLPVDTCTYPDTSLLELVNLIKNRQSSMCFVLNEQGKTLGLVTLGTTEK